MANGLLSLTFEPHNSHDKRRKLREDWIHSKKGLNSGKDMDRQLMAEMFDRIAEEPLYYQEEPSQISSKEKTRYYLILYHI